ncbi:MAG: hypothetical protein WC782_15445 [Methylococcaceae bacterium]|jgi:hypothetical protein
MISVASKFLVLLLTLLQFIAPLVHAHTGSPNPEHGLHVPGLEQYSVVNNDSYLETTDQNKSSNSAIVAVNMGIKHINYTHSIIPPGHYWVSSADVFFNLTISSTDSNFSPQELLPNPQLYLAFSHPRAPPKL